MCARYELTTTPEWMIERFGLRLPGDHDARKPRALERGEIRPTNLAPIVMAGSRLEFRPWGLAVSWQSQPLINARAETLEVKATFRPLLAHRCLIPASAYFEWRKAGKAKIKTRIRTANDAGFAMAGLAGDGRFSVVTCAPTAAIAHIHDRMPVILSRAIEAAWLDPAIPFSAVKPMLVPCADELVWQETATPPAQADLFV